MFEAQAETSEAPEIGGPRVKTIGIGKDRTGEEREIPVLSFGEHGARPKVYIQTALHADELPGMLVVKRLVDALRVHAENGDIIGEIVIVPVANPIGLKQLEGDYMQGRVERGTNRNFNRGFPDLAALAQKHLNAPLGDAPEQNTAAIRAAMKKGLSTITPADAFETLQHALISLSFDADIVLDLHADNEAQVHLYISRKNWPEAEDLAAEIDARAILLCGPSSDLPFDEANGGAWETLAEAYPDAAIAPACTAATLELRSNNAVSSKYADQDCRALSRFLTRRGLIKGEVGGMPGLAGRAIPVDELRRIKSPIEGVIDYRLRLGDKVRTGDVIADIIPPFGDGVSITAEIDGVLFARHDQTWAWPGKTIGKIAGEASRPEPGNDESK